MFLHACYLERVHMCMYSCRYVRTCVRKSPFGHVWMSVDVCGCEGICVDVRGRVWLCVDVCM